MPKLALALCAKTQRKLEPQLRIFSGPSTSFLADNAAARVGFLGQPLPTDAAMV
jgi:hypothetical protein